MTRRLSHPIIMIWLVSVVTLIAIGAGAAEPSSAWFYRAWQTEDGLPDNDITGVSQSSDGYLWVATKGGLLRFNGKEFVPIPQGNLPILPSRAVRAMLRDHRDRLWLGMERGPIFCVKPDGLEIFTVADGLLNQRVIMMAEDREGAVWVSYPNELRRIKDGKVTPVTLPSTWPAGGGLAVASDARRDMWVAKGSELGVFRDGAVRGMAKFEAPITSLCAGAKSGLWLCVDRHLFKFEAGQEPVKHIRLPGRIAPLVMREDGAGALWIGTAADGLFRLEGGRLESISTSHHQVTCLAEDQEGNLWAGTAGGGLNLIRFRTVELLDRAAGLPFESALSVCEDAAGRLWVASQSGALARGLPGDWELMSAATNWPGGNAICVTADAHGGVWVGTSDRGLHHFHNGIWREWRRADGLANDSIRSVMVASNGDVWLAAESPIRLQRLRDGKVVSMSSASRLGPIRALAEAADGTIWIGTAEGDIKRVSGLSLVDEPAVREPVPLSVRSLLITPDGSLWIGYAGDGLGRLKDGKYKRITMAEGLKDDFVSQMLADESGNLWITGNHGLSRVPLWELDAVMAGKMARLTARAYGRSDALPVLQPSRDNYPAACRSHDGRLWFAMRSGLLMVQPENIQDNPLPPPVIIEQVSVDDQSVAAYHARSPLQNHSISNVLDLVPNGPALRIPPGHRKLEFNFAALSLTSPENDQFRYQLKGYDQKWVEAGEAQNAKYPQLPAGSYEFRVLACNNAGVWNETGASLALVVDQFFWETWWFKVGGGLVTVLAAAGSVLILARRRYRRKLQRLEAKRQLEQERSRIARDIHDDLGASLTRITLLSQSARRGSEASDGSTANLDEIHSTAQQLTHAMGEVVWAVNPEHDTFDGLANYLSNYAQGFLRVAGVRCRLEMPLQLPAQPLSAEVRHNLFLAFKEALNNVVKHAQATEVRISLTPGKTGFVLVVEDNGRGFPAQLSAGNGLANMRRRLQEISGTCECQPAAESGTKIIFTVTLKGNI